MSDFDVLLGRKITSVLSDADHETLVFQTDAGRFGFYAEGDCCSQSWFNHVTNLSALVGHSVTRVEVHEETDGEATKQEYDRIYGFTLHTEAGSCQIEMRNSSNGYYGGYLTRQDDVSASETLSSDF